MLSYVIQNLYKPTNLVSSTHRFKLLLHFNNLILMFTFFKLYLVYNRLPKHLTFIPLVRNEIIAKLFHKDTVFFESKFTSHSSLHLATKFHRALWITSLVLISKILSYKNLSKQVINTGPFLVTCTYFFPVEAVFFSSFKCFYKPFFTFLMILSPLHWPVIERYYRYSNAFFYVNFFFKTLYFENIKIFRTQLL